ncbi:MAG: hypothetical protein WB817_10685 [Terriglobales bacterium]
MSRIVNCSLLFLLACSLSFAADKTSFHVKIQRRESPKSRTLIDKSGVLTFDDATRRLAFTGGKRDSFDVNYDDVTKAQFEVTTHMRDDTLTAAAGLLGLTGVAAHSLLQLEHVHDYWFYLEYKNGEHNEQALLELPKDFSEAVIAKSKSLFGSRVIIPVFQEHGEPVDPQLLPAIHSKQSIRVNWKIQPLPELKPDKATVVVVCPRIRNYDPAYGNQFKLHANDRVIAVNQEGTYSIAYVEPGKYHLVSQSANANGFDMELEADKAYYFLQNIFEGAVKNHTMLSRNSEELVMYELNGSYFSDWKPK